MIELGKEINIHVFFIEEWLTYSAVLILGIRYRDLRIPYATLCSPQLSVVTLCYHTVLLPY